MSGCFFETRCSSHILGYALYTFGFGFSALVHRGTFRHKVAVDSAICKCPCADTVGSASTLFFMNSYILAQNFQVDVKILKLVT